MPLKVVHLWMHLWKLPVLDTEDASEGETGKKDREFTGIKEQYVILVC